MTEPMRRDFLSLGVKLAILADLPPYSVPKIADALEQITLDHKPAIHLNHDRAPLDRRGEMLNQLFKRSTPKLKKMGGPG